MALPDDRQTLLILGASGDLTSRLLLPGLGDLLASEDRDDLLLVGSGTDDWDDRRWRKVVSDSFPNAGTGSGRPEKVAAGAIYVTADVTRADDLKNVLGRCRGQITVYFALPPAVTIKACEALAGIDLPDDMRLVMEKPFGTDAESAEALNRLVTDLVPERQVFRVDHFLGMSTVLNIVGLRFANRVLEPLFSSDHVESVEIIWDEDLGLEGRAGYYDWAGAMVDMIQSHLLEVLALMSMEAPASMGARDFRDSTSQVLRATRIWEDDPEKFTRRARYTAGSLDGRELPDYAAEDGVDPARKTETFAELVLAIDNWRWSGVPFRVRSGKAIGSPGKQAVVTFREPQWTPEGLGGTERPDQLRIGLGFGADELHLDLNINGPGHPLELDPVTMTAGFGAGDLHEYGQVLRKALEGDPLISVRGDTAVECWRIIEPVRKAWAEDRVPLGEYTAGSDGPEGWPEHGLPAS
ncbi:MAG: glucose-6-phosphate dehydrogenase [Actinomycetota bacterium]|nr:glucose-6-phosphate dehydrogenase [Actinomycetota bacterium]